MASSTTTATAQSRYTIAFIGLGDMGSRMTKRLLEAGNTVIGYNRTKSKGDWLVPFGMKQADTIREAVAESGAQFIFSCVTNDAALRSVAFAEIVPALSAGQIYIDCSTVSPALTKEIAAAVAARGARFLDAPVSGSIYSIEQYTASFMVGSDDAEAVEKARPVLLAIGPKVTHVGGNGLGSTMKIATNLNIAVQVQGFVEGVVLAEKAGIPRASAVEVLLHSAVASPVLKYRGPFVLQPPARPLFDVGMMMKDLALALELGAQMGVPLPTAQVSNEMLAEAKRMGLEHEDYAIVIEPLASKAGLPSLSKSAQPQSQPQPQSQQTNE